MWVVKQRKIKWYVCVCVGEEEREKVTLMNNNINGGWLTRVWEADADKSKIAEFG